MQSVKMNNALYRCYTLCNCLVAALVVALALNFLSSLPKYDEKNYSGAIQHVKTHELSRVGNQTDRAMLELFLQYDLTKAFDWGTHVVFLYVTASYKTARHARNELTIHNKVITTPDEAYQAGTNLIANYYLNDFSRALRNKNVTLKVFYSICPLAGPLKTFQLAETNFTMPANYVIP